MCVYRERRRQQKCIETGETKRKGEKKRILGIERKREEKDKSQKVRERERREGKREGEKKEGAREREADKSEGREKQGGKTEKRDVLSQSGLMRCLSTFSEEQAICIYKTYMIYYTCKEHC
eukprot:1395447-Amorphochlora_amoeboformis.AAC.2